MRQEKVNLDLKCAATAQQIAQKLEGEELVGKVLGILQEDGVYACFLYLFSRKDEHGAGDIFNNLLTLLYNSECPLGLTDAEKISKLEYSDLPRVIGRLGENLDQLFFAKEIMERTLIYTRYNVKARITK